MLEFIKKLFTNIKYYFTSQKGYKYIECSKKDMPNWVIKKWNKLSRRIGSDLDLENKTFYFKGKTYRYIIKTGMAIGQGGTSSTYTIKDYQYYKQKRRSKQNIV